LAQSGGSDKTFPVRPSASVTVRPFLVMRPYLSTAFIEGKLTGKNPRLYGLIKPGSGWVHPFKPERCFSFAEPG
ncbi:hypothetical protein ACUNFV_27555, partial [Serratia sp. IR-2025]